MSFIEQYLEYVREQGPEGDMYQELDLRVPSKFWGPQLTSEQLDRVKEILRRYHKTPEGHYHKMTGWAHFEKHFDPANNMVHNKLLVELVISELRDGHEDLMGNIGASIGSFKPKYRNEVIVPLHSIGITSQDLLEDFIMYLRVQYDMTSSSLFCNVAPKD